MTDEWRLRLPISYWLQISDDLGSVGFEVRIGALKRFSGATFALDDFEILSEHILLSQMVDTARVKVAERREDEICGNVGWPLCSARSLRYRHASQKKGECDRLEKSRVC